MVQGGLPDVESYWFRKGPRMRFFSLKDRPQKREAAPVERASRFPIGRTVRLGCLALAFLAVQAEQAEARRRHHHGHRHHAVIETRGGGSLRSGGYAPPYAEFVYDVNAGKVLDQVNPDALRHPASITKVMTLYLLFEQLEKGKLTLDSELEVSSHAAAQAPSKLGLRPGQTIAVEDAIKAIVTRSANDVAVVIGENIAGSEPAFAELMTRKARAIGMRNTLFRNASGLPNDEQVTTARDLATLGRVIQDRFPKYYRYFSTRSFAYRGAVIGNHNRLLGRVEGVDGIKTGYTRASGFNLLTSAKLDGHHIIAVVLGGRTGRARDNKMAALLEEHMPNSAAGGRRQVEVAEAEEEDAPRSTVAVAAPVAIQPPAPRAVERPKPAVVAEFTRPAPERLEPARQEIAPATSKQARVEETPRRSEHALPERTLPQRSNASGTTTVRVGAVPAVAASTTPSGPGLRWMKGAPANPLAAADPRIGQPTDPARRKALGLRAEADLDEDGSLTTASIAARAIPVADAKTEGPARSEPAYQAAAVQARKPAAPVEQPKAAMQERPSRTGWIIQLAATDNESKALEILSEARTRNRVLLHKAESFTEKVQKNGSTLYRARFAGFEAPEAEAACKALKRSGYACIALHI